MSENQAVANQSAPQGGLPVTASLRPLLLLVGLAAAVAAGADTAQLTTSLEQAGIKYKLQGGNVLVPSEHVDAARLSMMKKGLPASTGFSIIEKDQGFGVSQFMENARYQHALEAELARTITSIRAVQGARVHLAVPQQSAFVRDRRPVSASVTLQLRSGARLDREQIDAIVNLVASSIPELAAEHVTLVDNTGRLLSAPEKDSEFAAREHQMELARRIGEEYSQSIVTVLSPLIGPDRVRAQVVAQIETATTEEAREQYRPESQVVRSEQTSEDISRNGAGPQGVPGALTNQPPQGGTALPPGARPAANAQAAAVATDPANSSKQSTRNYEIDRTVAYTRTPAGRLQRLSVAVAIDNLRTTDAEGKVTQTPLTPEQLAAFTTLVKGAVGFNEQRGDSVSVVNEAFLVEAPAAAGEMDKTPIWQHPLVRDIAKLVAGLVILVLLLLLVIKPLVRNLATPMRAVMAPAQPAAQMAGELPPTAARPGAPLAYEQQIAQARSLVAKDPARVAQVVKDWVQNDE